jgi:hypothetical protein
VGSRSTALCLDKLDNQGGDGEAVQPEKTPALTVFYHPHSWHCDRNCNTATVFPFDRTNSTLREKGGGGEGCLCVGNLTTGDKKTAPNGFHSEPFFRLRSFFNFVTFHP